MEQSRSGERSNIATLVLTDFRNLIIIFDCQLAQDSKLSPEARAAIAEARSAARRGLELTVRLATLLETAH